MTIIKFGDSAKTRSYWMLEDGTAASRAAIDTSKPFAVIAWYDRRPREHRIRRAKRGKRLMAGRRAERTR